MARRGGTETETKTQGHKDTEVGQVKDIDRIERRGVELLGAVTQAREQSWGLRRE